MIILAILTALLFLGGLVFTTALARNLPPGKHRMQKQLQRLKADTGKWAGELVPLSKEELDLLSHGQQKHAVSKRFGYQAKGVYTSIFHEPLLAYNYRKYLGKKRNALLYARTHQHEYVYWVRNGRTTLYIDGQEVGRIEANGILHGLKTGKELARIHAGGNQKLLPVKVGDREVGSLTPKPGSAVKGLNERAFEFLREDMTEKEELLFLALAVKTLVEGNLE
jgi:hypothetical protein